MHNFKRNQRQFNCNCLKVSLTEEAQSGIFDGFGYKNVYEHFWRFYFGGHHSEGISFLWSLHYIFENMTCYLLIPCVAKNVVENTYCIKRTKYETSYMHRTAWSLSTYIHYTNLQNVLYFNLTEHRGIFVRITAAN